MCLIVKAPDKMLTAVQEYCFQEHMQIRDDAIKDIVEAALGWMVVNLNTLTDEQCVKILFASPALSQRERTRQFIWNWMKMTFLELLTTPVGFMECDACRAKPGSPTLCPSCLHNRGLIEELYRRTTSGRHPLQVQEELKQESVPEEVKKLANWNEVDTTGWLSYDSVSVARALADKHNREVMEAYNIGLEVGRKGARV